MAITIKSNGVALPSPTEIETGDEIIWSKGMTVTYEDLSDEDDALNVVFCFVLNDVFGEYTMTDPIAFRI